MRKIDKSKIFSTRYKDWEAGLEKKGIAHPVYNSSKNKYYKDVVLNLLHVQGGLCAYTEMKLCPKELIEKSNWKNGSFIEDNPQFKGQLDHFDPDLKTDKAWLWDNFFMVDTDINTKVKGKKKIDPILKPDLEAYREEELLEYDCNMHIYIPNSSLDVEKQNKVKEMILKLGINFDPVIDSRKEYLNDKLTQKNFGIPIEINQFPTAFKMCETNN